MLNFITERQSDNWRTTRPFWRHALSECLLVISMIYCAYNRQKFRSGKNIFNTCCSHILWANGRANQNAPLNVTAKPPSALCMASVHTVSAPVYVWFMLSGYCAVFLMHANPMTLAVCGLQCRERGGQAKYSWGFRHAPVLTQNLARTRPPIPERKAACGFQQGWHTHKCLHIAP